MDALLQKIIGLVTEAGGSMEWQALVDALDAKEQRRLMDAIRMGKKQGVLSRDLAYNAETGLSPLTVSLVSQAENQE